MMFYFVHPPSDQLAALRAEDVQIYVASRGWKRDDASSTPKGNVYRYPALRDAEALIPSRRDLADYVERMADVVQMLAAVEQRSAWEIIADLSSPPADVLRLRISAPNATLGTLPLDEGIRLIDGARSLLLAAACSARQAAAFYPRQAYKEALEFLQACHLGQTERGSFVAKIMAPVPPEISRQGTLFDTDEGAFIASEPFARQSTVRLMSALGHIRGSIDSGNYDQILEGVGEGVSANLCEAVASMQPEGDQAHLHIRMTWSSSRPRLPKTVESAIGFSRTAFEIVRESGRKLREELYMTRKRLEGRVISLKADPSLLDDFEGMVTLKADVGGTPTRVQVLLRSDEYKMACNAHRDGLVVAVTGLLQREAKLYYLRQAQDFSVVTNQ
jgi:hypothetical protein